MKDSEVTARIQRINLARLAEQVAKDDPRRRILENLDAIAQMAIDMERYFEGTAYPAPELQTAIKAQIAQAALLAPEFDKARARHPSDQNAIVEAIRRTAIEGERLRMLSPIGKGKEREEAT